MMKQLKIGTWSFFADSGQPWYTSLPLLVDSVDIEGSEAELVADAVVMLCDDFNLSSGAHGDARRLRRANGECIENFRRYDHHLSVKAINGAVATEFVICAETLEMRDWLAIPALERRCRRLSRSPLVNVVLEQESDSQQLTRVRIEDSQSITSSALKILGIGLCRLGVWASLVGVAHGGLILLLNLVKILLLEIIQLLPGDIQAILRLLVENMCSGIGSFLAFSSLGVIASLALANVLACGQRIQERRLLSHSVKHRIIGELRARAAARDSSSYRDGK